MNTLDRSLKRGSRMLALGGLAAVAFGAVILLLPKITLVAFLALFGVFALMSGAFMLGTALNHLAERRTDWVPYVLGGLAGLAAGGFTFFRPGITGLVLLYLIAGYAIATGVFEIAASFDLWDEIRDSWLLGLAGALSIAFGALVALYPAAGALSILWLIGTYAIVVGVIRLVYAYRVHRFHGAIREAVQGIRAAS